MFLLVTAKDLRYTDSKMLLVMEPNILLTT